MSGHLIIVSYKHFEFLNNGIGISINYCFVGMYYPSVKAAIAWFYLLNSPWWLSWRSLKMRSVEVGVTLSDSTTKKGESSGDTLYHALSGLLPGYYLELLLLFRIIRAQC